MVSIPACHAGNPGSIPGLGAFCLFFGLFFLFAIFFYVLCFWVSVNFDLLFFQEI